MKTVLVLVCFLLLSMAVAQKETSPDTGVIYGTVTTPDGLPAQGLTLNADPLGGNLAAILPSTKTNDKGIFRFEHLRLGRYTVFAEDKKAGYTSVSTRPAGTDHRPEVKLMAEHPEAEFNFQLPPKAGFLLFHLTNRKTSAAISGVEVTVMSADVPPGLIVSEGCSADETILVPSDRNLLLHVTSWGSTSGIKVQEGECPSA